MLITALVRGDMEKVLDRVCGIDEKDHEFFLTVRYLVEIQDEESLKIVFTKKSMKKYGDTKAVSLAAMGSLKIFKLFKPLYDVDYTIQGHPLLSACSTGNAQIVEYMIPLIRKGKFPVKNPKDLKKASIKIAARRGNIRIIKSLCKDNDREGIHSAVSIMITNGQHRKIPRLLDHPAIDFSHNDFELLRACSPYVVELFEIARHKSVYSNYDKLTPEYYKLVVDAARQKFNHDREQVQKHHEKKVLETCKMIHTGANTGEFTGVRDDVKNFFLYMAEKPVNMVSEFNKRDRKSAATGDHVNHVSEFNTRDMKSAATGALHDIQTAFNRSAKTADDIQAMVTGVHLHHKPQCTREMRKKNLEKFELN